MRSSPKPDNGFGGKANPRLPDPRAYFVRPDFETASEGTGPGHRGGRRAHRLPHPDGHLRSRSSREAIGLDGLGHRPRVAQRDHRGDLWVGDEFGPWIPHFDADGVLLAAPIPVPGLRSPSNPTVTDAPPANHPNSRGFEAMAISPDGKRLYVILEGRSVNEASADLRRIYEFDVDSGSFTGRTWTYQVAPGTQFVSDVAALDRDTLVVIERDGAAAVDRDVYRRPRRGAGDHRGEGTPRRPRGDPRPGPDLALARPAKSDSGDPFRRRASRSRDWRLRGHELVIECDNNIPNARRAGVADDTEFVLIDLSSAKSGGDGGWSRPATGATTSHAPGRRHPVHLVLDSAGDEVPAADEERPVHPARPRPHSVSGPVRKYWPPAVVPPPPPTAALIASFSSSTPMYDT